MVKCCDEAVDFFVGPIVEQIGTGQLWEGGLHCSGLLDGTLFDAMTMIRWGAGEALLEGLSVEESDRKGADAATGAATSAGNLPEQGGGCPLKPVIGFFIERSKAGQRGI